MGRQSDPQALAAALQQQGGGAQQQRGQMMQELARRQQMQQAAVPQAQPQFGKGGNVPTVQAGQSAQAVQGAPQQAQPPGGKFGGVTGQMNRMGSPEAAAQQQMAMQQARNGQARGAFSGIGKGNKPPAPQV